MADFHTEIVFRGVEEEYYKLTKVLRFYSQDRADQYKRKKDCWYLEGTAEKKFSEIVLDGGRLVFHGPYGLWKGPFSEEIDLFERIADVIPGSCFTGSISGWDAGGEQSIEAELKDGLLYLRSSFTEFDGCIEQDELQKDDDNENKDIASWDTVYNPSTHEYHKPEVLISDSDEISEILKQYRTDIEGSRENAEIVKAVIKKILPLCSNAAIRKVMIYDGDSYADIGAIRYLNEYNLEELTHHLYFMCSRSPGNVYTHFCDLVKKIIDYERRMKDGTDKETIIRWKTKKLADKKAKIVSCNIDSFKEETINLIIPDEINGDTITEIEPDVFKIPNNNKVKSEGLSKIISITYPKTIREIPDTGSVTVKSIFFEGKPLSIGRLGSELYDFVIPETVQTIGREAFYYCDTLKHINLPTKLKKIDESAFAYSALEEIVIPQSVNRIGENAFSHMPNLRKIQILAKKIKIDASSFLACDQLEEVVIESETFGLCNKIPILFANCERLKQIVCKNTETAKKLLEFCDRSITDKIVVKERQII